MTKPPAMPELPEPELGYIETDKSKQPAFSAAQMRAALQSAQPAAAEVSDVELLTAYNRIDPCNESPTDRLIRRLRAILALRPQAVPMTDEQVDRIWNALPMGNGFWLSFARAVEAHHGITQRADGGEKQA